MIKKIPFISKDNDLNVIIMIVFSHGYDPTDKYSCPTPLSRTNKH